MSAEAVGRSQGGFSAKIHLRAESQGKPLPILITAGQRREQTVFEALMEQGTVKRLVNRFKQLRRIATRDEKRAINYLGMLTPAAIMLWL